MRRPMFQEGAAATSDYYIVPVLLGCSVSNMLNKNTLGVKKVRGQSEAALQTGATKNFDIS